ncbi:hypothetical protein BaRGS_00021515 [Batillaria attramentaria]|uniref:ShKT domain-containing protein n=1 Tax=Batillaria attramentaria TaxID=370345 RepID=A0ABD0KJZ2_9CAEN
MHVSGQRVGMNCKVKNHDEQPLHGNNHHMIHVNDFQHCFDQELINSENCRPTLTNYTGDSRGCYYCCLDQACYEDHVQHCNDHGKWSCRTGEFCAFTVNGNGHVSEVCKDKALMENCIHNLQNNEASCNPISTHPTGHKCHYCCEDEHCLTELLQIHQPKHCYVNGTWACESDEYCQIHKGPDGVDMSCKSDFNFTHWLDNYEICEKSQSLNDPSCNHTRLGLASQHDCFYCCQSEECFRNVFNLPKPTTTAASTTAASTPLTSATPTHCYADSDWACQSEEFCALTISSSDLVMICQDINSTWEGCVSEQDQNAESCSPTLTSTEGPDCHYCCKSERCFADLLLHTDHLVTTEVPSKDCIQSGQWACESHEFCALKFGSATTIKCEDIDSQWQSCMDSGVLCSPNKLSGAEFSECSYCCRDLDCIMGLLRPSASTTTPTPSSTYWTPATTGHQTVTEAPPDTKTCFHNGAWACQTDENCLDSERNNDPACHARLRDASVSVRGNCSHCCLNSQCITDLFTPPKPVTTTPEPGTTTSEPDTTTSEPLTTTETVATSAPMTNAPTTVATVTTNRPLVTYRQPGHNSCYTSECHIGDTFEKCISGEWACRNDQFCRIRTYIATGELAMDCLPATGTELLSCGQESSLKTCHQPEDFNNHDCHFCCLHHDCVVDKSNILITKETSTTPTQPTTATSPLPRTSPPSATDDCVDSYVGDCSKDFAGRCSESYIMEICAKSCGTCDCPDTIADCTVKYSDQCTNPLVQQMCPRTCRVCHMTESTTTVEPTTPTTTSPPTSPTTSLRPGPGMCAVCSALDCLLSDPSNTPCDSGSDYCITTVKDTTHGRDIERKCASLETCNNITLKETCQSIENKILGVGVTCEYCCSAPNCNAPPGLIPEKGLITHHPLTMTPSTKLSTFSENHPLASNPPSPAATDPVSQPVTSSISPPTETSTTTSPRTPTPTGVCAVCSALDCLLSDPSNTLCDSGSDYCITTVKDTTHGRDIERKCASLQTCNDITLKETCQSIENKILGVGVTCEYCCSAPNCNAPPGLIPEKGLITHHR